MIKNFVGGMVVRLAWRAHAVFLHPVHHTDVAHAQQTLNLAVAHALNIELQSLDDIVAVNLATHFGHRVVIATAFALKPLPVIHHATFCGFFRLAFGAGRRKHGE